MKGRCIYEGEDVFMKARCIYEGEKKILEFLKEFYEGEKKILEFLKELKIRCFSKTKQIPGISHLKSQQIPGIFERKITT